MNDRMNLSNLAHFKQAIRLNPTNYIYKKRKHTFCVIGQVGSKGQTLPIDYYKVYDLVWYKLLYENYQTLWHWFGVSLPTGQMMVMDMMDYT